jgi:hypothetical protein
MTQHAIDNAKAWFNNIREMVAAFNDASDAATNAWRDAEDQTRTSPAHDLDRVVEDTQTAIHESPLSVQVRSGWYSPDIREAVKATTAAAEYEILLTTGGPALRIVGDLSDYAEPTNARLQWQDWGTPWTDLCMSELPIKPSEADAILLAYVAHFYFGG